jgi:nucleoside 2-deoxyribosyltransferase
MAEKHQQFRIYLAGPEVFLPDPLAAGQRKIALAAKHDLLGVYPLDASLDLTGLSPNQQAALIAEANEGLMRSCDAAIANLTPFRGVSMDSGTAYEVGFMRALGRPVFGYTNVTPDYAARTRAYRARGVVAGDSDRANLQIEDFGHAENLMIACGIEYSGSHIVCTEVTPGQEMEDLHGFEACLVDAKRVLPAISRRAQ